MSNVCRNLSGRIRHTTGAAVWLAILSFLLISIAVLADDWPHWLGPNRNGISQETEWLVRWPPTQVWRAQIGEGYSSVSVVSNRLYVVGRTNDTMDVVYCFDVDAGTQVWARAYACDTSGDNGYHGHRATPTVDGNELYTYSSLGHLRCWDRMSGASNWSVTVNVGSYGGWWGFAGSPLIEGNLVIVGAGGAGVAIDKVTHTNVWTSSSYASYASPVPMTYNSQRSIAIWGYYYLYGKNPLTGATNWSYAWTDGYHIADPVFYKDKIFVTEGGNTAGARLIQLGSGTLTSVWQNASMSSHISTPIIIGDYAYGFDRRIDNGPPNLRCIDLSNSGSLQWSTNDFGGMLIAAQDNLIVLRDNGDLMILKATNTLTLVRPAVQVCANAQSETWWTIPVLANGKIYCRSHQGSLVCLQIGGQPPDDDTDGIADSWEALYFTTTNNCSPTGHGDSDRYDNFHEYIAGTNPTNAQDCLSVRIGFSNGQIVVTYPSVDAFGTGYENLTRLYSLETSTDLTGNAWDPVPGATNLVGDGSTKLYTNAPTGDKQFYRVRVKLQ